MKWRGGVFRQAGQFATASQILEEGLASAEEPAAVETLREALSEMRSASRAARNELLADATGRRAAGELDAAIALLEARVEDFPAQGGRSGLTGRIQEWRAERDSRWRAQLGLPAGSTLDGVTRTVLDSARRAERSGDWATARAELAKGIEAVRTSKPGLAETLRRRAADLVDLDAFAVAGFVAAFMQCIEAGGLRQYEARVFHHLVDEFWLVAVFCLVAVVVILPYVGDVLEEQHGQDEVFVGIGADGATEGVTGVPQGFVDAVLIDLVVHAFFSLSCC